MLHNIPKLDHKYCYIGQLACNLFPSILPLLCTELYPYFSFQTSFVPCKFQGSIYYNQSIYCKLSLCHCFNKIPFKLLSKLQIQESLFCCLNLSSTNLECLATLAGLSQLQDPSSSFIGQHCQCKIPHSPATTPKPDFQPSLKCQPAIVTSPPHASKHHLFCWYASPMHHLSKNHSSLHLSQSTHLRPIFLFQSLTTGQTTLVEWSFNHTLKIHIQILVPHYVRGQEGHSYSYYTTLP